MINLMIKNIVENSNKIDVIVKHVNKMHSKYFLSYLLLGGVVYYNLCLNAKHEEEINNLKKELEEMKSKGE